MSITFAAEITGTDDARVFEVRCDDGSMIGEFVGYANAYGEAQAHALVCTLSLCQGYGADMDEVFADDAPVPVNVHNANAVVLLDALGYAPAEHDASDPFDVPDLAGDAGAADFLGRVELALGLAPVDAGRPATQDARWLTGARRPGYLQDRLAELRNLALACQRSGARVTWA
jgi:hypothetical protein